MKRRFLSVLLALSMALTLTPAAAWADELSAEPADQITQAGGAEENDLAVSGTPVENPEETDISGNQETPAQTGTGQPDGEENQASTGTGQQDNEANQPAAPAESHEENEGAQEEDGIQALTGEEEPGEEATAEEALRAAIEAGGEVTLTEDVMLADPISVKKPLTLDLDGHTIGVAENAEIWKNDPVQTALFHVHEDMTIKNDKQAGGVIAKKDDSYAVAVYNGAKLTVDCTNETKFTGNLHTIYVHTGSAVINGGTYDILQHDNVKPHAFILNCLDKNATNGTASITVNKGVLVGVDPRDTLSDMEDPTNYVASTSVVTESEKMCAGCQQTVTAYTVTPADGLIGEKGTAGSTTTVTITGDATSGKVDDDNTEEGSLGGNANKITVDASGGGQEAKADAAVTIPADTAQTMENVNAIEVKADNVTVELPAASVKNIAEAAKGEDVETVTITVKQDATSEQKVAAQYTVEVKSGETDLLGAGNANGTIKITVPKPEGDAIFVYWVSADGRNVLGEMAFDIIEGNIVFTTTHLSTYQVRTEAAPVAEAVYTKDDGSQASGTLSQAVENAKNGTKILLNNDVKLGAGLTIAKDRNIAIEGNNHTITMDATATGAVMFTVQNGGSSDKNTKGKLTLQNVTLDGSNKRGVWGIWCKGDLILTNTTVKNFDCSETTHDNGGVCLTHKATMTISGGSIQDNKGMRYDEPQLQYSHYADDLWVGSEAKATLQDGAQVGRVFVNANEFSGSVPDNGLTVNDATVDEAFTEADNEASQSGTVIVAAGQDGTIKKLIIALGRTQSDMDLGRTTAVAENVSAANGEIKTEYSDATFKIPAGLTVKLTEGNLTEKLEIGAGATVIIPESVTVTVKASGDPAEAPEITNNGTLQVDGALIAGANDAATTTDDVYLNISGSGKIEAGAGATVDIDPEDPNYTKLTFTFHFNDGTGTVVEKNIFVADGEKAEFSAIKPADPTRSGYTFKGWFAAETGGTAIADDAQFEEDTEFYAQWDKKSKPRPDAGGSGGGGASAATSTVTISSDGSSIKADVKISNGTATIGKVDDIKKVIGEDVVTIDASNLKKDVDTVKVDSSIVNAIANNEDSEGLEVKLSDGTVTFDAAAVAGFKGGDLSVTWDKTNTNSLNSKQKDAVKDMDVQGSYKLTLNKALKNGEAEIRAAFAVPDGKDASDLALLRVGTDGTAKEVSARFSGGELRFTATESGDYVVVAKAGEQTTEPAEPTAPAQNNTDFRDVDAGAWYGNAVNYVAANGLMSGVGDGLFVPNTNLSRAMLAQILYNHAGRPAADGASAFTDVPAGMWYTNAVAWATAQGVVSGYGSGLFGPNDNITREQLAVMLYRYAGSPAAEGSLGSFADAGKVSAYAQNALIWATTNGVMSGKGGGNLDPAGMATRAEVAQMLYNYLNR